MSEERPHWYTAQEPDAAWNEADAARFDGAGIIPHPLPVYRTPAPLDPQQPTPEQIADAARLAADDIGIVCRHWGYIQTYPLTQLRALLDALTPPPPLRQCGHSAPGHYCWECEVIQSDHDDYLLP